MDIQTEHYITGDPAFAVDPSGVIVFWNEAAKQAFGYEGSEALGKKCWELLGGIDVNGNRYCFENCPLIEMSLLHEPVHAFRSSFGTASHQQKQFSVSCVTVFNEPGEDILLHICHPEQTPLEAGKQKTPLNIREESLSQRETEVLELLAKKVSTRDIASRLSISVRTVRTHIQHLMYKLRVHKRSDAIVAAKHLKLI